MIAAEVKGALEVQQKLEQVIVDLHGAPMLTAMRRATLIVQTDAKAAAPVDTGRLRASITPEVRTSANVVQGVVGSNVEYAPYMELGTGTHVGRPAYFPPPAALEVWARRHGFPNGFVVARAIFRAGGMKGRKFLQGAFEKNKTRIQVIIGDAVAEIVSKSA